MKRQFCQVKHDPENGTYGDCLRACVATLLGHDVPHFFHDGCDGAIAQKRLREYLATVQLVPFFNYIDGSTPKSEIFDHMAQVNCGVPYILFCRCGSDGDHTVVCRDDEVIFNPAWTPYPVSGPTSQNMWSIMVLVKL